ncbi:hypothetical protein FA15DRAFT_707821 [Coprinopsis marcescibilis]|uniref:Uncharacterized protein n=1 Tax=Coprinopsis marcescibilis TaxID=230819 RepID=A0A5C3KXT9_COPMA|nr:hypothetical protein FA15DRAFT_707821 [Coprinopsis marcescibilis]
MVLALLLSDASKPVCYRDLDRVVFQCLLGAHSMWKALSIFHQSVRAGCAPSKDHIQSPLSAFDAHIGDCACQVRSQMIWELIEAYREPTREEILQRAIETLAKVRAQAAFLLHEVVQGHGKGRKLRPAHLDALTTNQQVWRQIGFVELFNFTGKVSPTLQSGLDQTATEDATPPSHDKAEWNVDNLFSMGRFLTLCFLLSESKVVELKDSPFEVKVRAYLAPMYSKISGELESLVPPSLRKGARGFCEGEGKLKVQRDSMQRHVSLITSDWVRKTSLRLGLHQLHESLSKGLIASNCKRFACAATFPSTLLLRLAWLRLDTPILLVVQRFCSHGELHIVYCRVTRTPAGEAAATRSIQELGESNWFHLDLVSAEELITSPWARLPHVVLIGMSGEGTFDDFRSRLLHISLDDHDQPIQPHANDCQEIREYGAKLRELNFPRFILHDAAHHPQFPFALPGDEDEYERVSYLLGEGLGEDVSRLFQVTKDGAEEFGAGKSLDKLFGLEHFFVEYPLTVVKEFKDKPVVYGCKVEA